jgi:hypothetical protein
VVVLTGFIWLKIKVGGLEFWCLHAALVVLHFYLCCESTLHVSELLPIFRCTDWSYNVATCNVAGAFQVGTALQPRLCSVLPVISFIKVLSLVRVLVCSSLHT